MVLASDATASWSLFILREQSHPTAAFDGIYKRTMGPVLSACAALTAKLMDLPEDDHRVVLAVLGLYGHITFFRTGREAALRMLRTRKLAETHLAEIKAELRRQTDMLGQGTPRARPTP
jgi:hypothetical protein